jgi:YbbR domain-containing protein
VTVTPGRTDVAVQVTQLGGYRDVAVKVKTSGQWATGFRLTNISVSPPTVTVFSTDPQRVNDLPGFVETTAVDLEGADDDLEARVALDLPAGITLVGGQETVLVQVSIAAIESNLTISLPVEIIGLAPGLEARIAPETVDVILFGPVPVLETLTPETVRVVVDLTDLAAGSHQLMPFVDILPNPVQEQGINPGTVEVVLSPLPTSTPVTTPAAAGPSP